VLGLIFAAALVAALAPSVIVVDDDGAPVAQATVRLSATDGSVDLEHTDRAGEVFARSGFTPRDASIEAPGFIAAHVTLGGGVVRVVLHRAPAVIGAVRVATGSPSSLHRLPVAASVLDAQAIRDTPAMTTDELLRDLPGFDRDRSNSAFTNYGQLRVSFDGAGNDRGVVLVDGIPAQDAFGGQVDWQAYPVGNITRAELLRGTGSALYGSGGVGGVLSLQTRSPFSAPGLTPDGVASVAVGGLSLNDESVFYRSGIGNGLAASVWTSTTASSYYITPEGMRTPIDLNARSQSDATQVRLRTLGGGPGTFEGSFLYSTDAQGQGRPNYDFGRTFGQESLRYEIASDRSDTSIAFYNRDTFVTNLADQFPTKPGVVRYVQHVPTWEDGIYAAWTSTGPNLTLDARADLRSVHGISDQRTPNGTLQAIGSGDQTLEGFALQLTERAGKFEALAGARYDSVSVADERLVTVVAATGVSTVVNAPARDDAAVSPRLALRYDLSPSVALRVSSGGGFRAPFLNELVRGFNVGAVQMAPNPLLIPERARTDSAGFDVLGRNSRLSFDVTRTLVSDAIAFVTMTPTLDRRENVAQTRTDGALATFTQSIGRCARVRLSGQTQYARVIEGPVDSIGKRLAFVPDRAATVAVEGQTGPFRYGVDASFLGQAYADDLNTEPLGSALVIGGRVSAPLGANGTITLLVQNLTDRQYLTSVDRLAEPSAVTLRATFPIGAHRTPDTFAGCSI
jgi:outer membrane receptor protein involved in Fe transport